MVAQTRLVALKARGYGRMSRHSPEVDVTDLAERPDVDGVAKGISDEDPQVPVPRPRRALFTAVLCSLRSVK